MLDWRHLEDFVRHLRSWHGVSDAIADIEDRSRGDLRLAVRFRGGHTEWYRLTRDELRMGGGLHHWMETVAQDIRRRADGCIPGAAAPPSHWEDALRYGPATETNTITGAVTDDYFHRALAAGMAGMLGGPLGGQPRNPEADAKAERLFISTAGQPAHDTLKAGKALPLKGSAGGDYTLHKRATYCVESKGTKYCAVVPGVPLWDHLLGIKLMIEQDEPKFLATANKAGAGLYDIQVTTGVTTDWGAVIGGAASFFT